MPHYNSSLITTISGKIETEILAKCDLCHNDPCRNGASCRPLPNRDYECACAPGFYGKNCDAVIDACYGNPCTNGATCQVMEAGRFTCQCPEGYSGVRYVCLNKKYVLEEATRVQVPRVEDKQEGRVVAIRYETGWEPEILIFLPTKT